MHTINAWLIYFILILDNIDTFFTILEIMLILLMIILTMAAIGRYNDDDHDKSLIYYLGKYLKIPIIYFLIFLTISVFMPTTKQAAAIYLLPQIIKDKNIQKLPPNLAKLLNEAVKKEILNLTTINSNTNE